MEEFATGVSFSSWGRLADKGVGGSVAFVSSVLAESQFLLSSDLFFFFFLAARAAAQVSKITINVGFNLVDFGVI